MIALSTMTDAVGHTVVVWESIHQNLELICNTWWENEGITKSIQHFIAGLFTPIVDKLGYVYASGDSADTRELRTLAIEAAAKAGSRK